MFPVGKAGFVTEHPCKRRLQSVLLNIELDFQAVTAFFNSVPMKTTRRCIVYLHKARQRYWSLPSWYVRNRKLFLPVEES